MGMLDSLRRNLHESDKSKKYDGDDNTTNMSSSENVHPTTEHTSRSQSSSFSLSPPLTARWNADAANTKPTDRLLLPPPPPYEATSTHHESSPTHSIFCVDPRVISDATIGLSDGLTVPFALTAGLAALGSSRVVVLGGLAELIAGSISMGLGGYLGARAESEAYANLVSSTQNLVQRYPDHALELLRDSLAPLGMDTAELETALQDSSSSHALSGYHSRQATRLDQPRLVQLLLRYVHSQPIAPSTSRAFYCALTIALAYFAGGFIPLLPYLFIAQVSSAFWWSVAVMVVSLAAFGAGKSLLLLGETPSLGREEVEGLPGKEDMGISRTRERDARRLRWRRTMGACARGAVQMVMLGGIAAGCAGGLVFVFDRGGQE